MKDKKHRIIIAGSRLMFQYRILKRILDKILEGKDLNTIELIGGGAAGADALGKLYAQKHNIEYVEFPADWKMHGKSAGAIRNDEMAAAADSCIVFWDGISRGSKHMISTAQKRGLKVLVHRYLTNKTESL